MSNSCSKGIEPSEKAVITQEKHIIKASEKKQAMPLLREIAVMTSMQKKMRTVS